MVNCESESILLAMCLFVCCLFTDDKFQTAIFCNFLLLGAVLYAKGMVNGNGEAMYDTFETVSCILSGSSKGPE
jgi:hypothetical protein